MEPPGVCAVDIYIVGYPRMLDFVFTYQNLLRRARPDPLNRLGLRVRVMLDTLFTPPSLKDKDTILLAFLYSLSKQIREYAF